MQRPAARGGRTGFQAAFCPFKCFQNVTRRAKPHQVPAQLQPLLSPGNTPSTGPLQHRPAEWRDSPQENAHHPNRITQLLPGLTALSSFCVTASCGSRSPRLTGSPPPRPRVHSPHFCTVPSLPFLNFCVLYIYKMMMMM